MGVTASEMVYFGHTFFSPNSPSVSVTQSHPSLVLMFFSLAFSRSLFFQTAAVSNDTRTDGHSCVLLKNNKIEFNVAQNMISVWL